MTTIRSAIATDLVISPFGADAARLLDAARCAEDSGFDGVWAVGSLVDNMVNRHPALLASAAATVQSMSAGRTLLVTASDDLGELAALGRGLDA